MVVNTKEGQVEEEAFALKLERTPLTSPDVPPIPVFHFAFTRVGNQILLEPGYVDLVELRASLQQLRSGTPGEASVRIYIKEKYVMDRDALVRLRDAAEEILQGMSESNEGDPP